MVDDALGITIARISDAGPLECGSGGRWLWLRSAEPHPVTLMPGVPARVRTGVRVVMCDPSIEVRTDGHPELLRQGIVTVPTAVTDDGEGTGEVSVVLWGIGHRPPVIRPGDRVARLQPFLLVEIETEDVTEAIRGVGAVQLRAIA